MDIHNCNERGAAYQNDCILYAIMDHTIMDIKIETGGIEW